MPLMTLIVDVPDEDVHDLQAEVATAAQRGHIWSAHTQSGLVFPFTPKRLDRLDIIHG